MPARPPARRDIPNLITRFHGLQSNSNSDKLGVLLQFTIYNRLWSIKMFGSQYQQKINRQKFNSSQKKLSGSYSKSDLMNWESGPSRV